MVQLLHLPRWITASIEVHMDNNKGEWNLFREGELRPTSNADDFFELRIDGPYIDDLCKDVWRTVCEVNCLVQTRIDGDLHRKHRIIGTVVAAMGQSIPIKRYGTGPEDDEKVIGCLRLFDQKRSRESIRVSHFGQADPQLEFEQAVVEAHYDALIY